MPPSSPARIAANRRNAQKSTGPRTAEGKEASRGNALRHGLAAEVLHTPAEAASVAAIPLDQWREREAAVLATRIERAHQVEERERADAALRAETCWDVDRARHADLVARGLARRPDRVVSQLRTTPHGCDWLITRWRWLLAAATRPGGWDGDQATLAWHLQGIPTKFHDGSLPTPEPAAEIRSLEATRATLEPSDRFRRESTRQGLNDEASPELRRALRYGGTLFRRLRWCTGDTSDAATDPAPKPRPKPAPRPPAPPPPPARRDPVADEDDDLLDDDSEPAFAFDLDELAAYLGDAYIPPPTRSGKAAGPAATPLPFAITPPWR